MVSGLADVAQLVEHQLPKLRVAGSNPVVRSCAPAREPRSGSGGGLLRAHSAVAASRDRYDARLLALRASSLSSNGGQDATPNCRFLL